jgi:hypothetical protein
MQIMSEGYTNYTVNYPHQAAWLVYFNGLEVPVTSVNVDFGVGKIPTCTIDMPPDPRLTRLGYEDRIEVAVFYLDDFYDPYNAQFCLMGEFDIMGWAYTNSAAGRSLRFMCVGTVQILQQLNMFYISSVDDIVNAYLPPTVTDAAAMTNVTIYFPASLFLQGLMPTQRPVSDLEGDAEIVAPTDFIKTPYQFIRNVFKSILSDVDFDNPDPNQSSDASKLPKSAISAPGKNFFAKYMTQRDLYRRFVGLPYIDWLEKMEDSYCYPLIRAVQSTEALKAIQSQLGASIGPAGTVWDLLRTVLGTMLMEIVTIPSPPIGMASVETGVIRDVFKGKRFNGDKSMMGVIASNFIKPQCYFGLPPTCNIVFPSMIQSLTLEEDYTPQPTRVYVGEQFLANMIAGKATGTADSLVSSTLTTGYPPVVQARMSQYMLSSDPNQNTKNFLIWPEEFYRGPVSRHLSAPPWLWMLDKLRKQLAPGTTFQSVQSMSQSKFVTFIKPTVERYASMFGIPIDYVWAFMYVESNMNANVNASSAGAIGIMQVMPGTAKGLTKYIKRKFPSEIPAGTPESGLDASDPTSAILLGVAHMSRTCEQYNIDKTKLTKAESQYVPEKAPTDAQLARFAYAYGEGNLQVLQGLLVGKKVYWKGTRIYEQNMTQAEKDKSMLKLQIEVNAVKKWQNPSWKEMTDNLTAAFDQSKAILAKAATGAAASGATVPAATPAPNATGAAATPGATTPPSSTAQTPAPGTTQPAPAPMPEPTQGVQVVSILQADGTYVDTYVDLYGDPVSAADGSDVMQYAGTDATPTTGVSIDPALAAETQITLEEIKALGKLFYLYAQYEYYRARYEARIGAAVLAFNPYIIPAFPTVMFDSKYSGISTYGYILNVTHNMSAAAGSPNMTTSINSAFQRTIEEALGDRRTGWDSSLWGEARKPYNAFPTEPITEVADIFQDIPTANMFYAQLLYNDKLSIPEPEDKTIIDAARSEEIRQYENDIANMYGTDAPKELDSRDLYAKENPEYTDARARREEMLKAHGSAKVFVFTNIIDMVRVRNGVTEHDVTVEDYTDDVELKVKPKYEKLFRSYDDAMSYVSRPVCTLRQYISLKHGMSVAQAEKTGHISGRNTSFYSSNSSKKGEAGGAVFWGRIYTLMQGPGYGLATKEQIYSFANCGPATGGYAPQTKWTIPPKTDYLPQTRQNWDMILLDYRNKVRMLSGHRGEPSR